MILDSLAFCHSEILSNFFIVAMFIELFIFIVYLLPTLLLNAKLIRFAPISKKSSCFQEMS